MLRTGDKININEEDYFIEERLLNLDGFQGKIYKVKKDETVFLLKAATKPISLRNEYDILQKLKDCIYVIKTYGYGENESQSLLLLEYGGIDLRKKN